MEFDKDRWKVYTWKHPLLLHWILNPGILINELILGQRVPMVSLIDKSSTEPRAKRSFIPCPHCQKLHDSRTWSTVNHTAFGNWFGLYCYQCGKVIPCLWNLGSLILLGLTFPLWIWFYKDSKKKWLLKQESRFEKLDLNSIPNPFEGKGWIKEGLWWGLFMFVFMNFVFPLFDDDLITLKEVLISIPIWTLAGLSFGYSMKVFMGKRGKKN